MNDTIINAIAIVLNIFNGIKCYQKYKVYNRKIFLFGILMSVIGVAFSYIGLLYSFTNTKVESNKKEEVETT